MGENTEIFLRKWLQTDESDDNNTFSLGIQLTLEDIFACV